MNGADAKEAGWKSKAIREVTEYYVVSMYLMVFFASFTWYRRLVLAEYKISYLHYGSAIIQALVLAKVILIGRAFNLGRRLQDRPLILPALYKAVVFSIFVGLFAIIEDTIAGLLHGKGLAGGIKELISTGADELIARCVVMFVAFIPFFVFDELERVLGERKLIRLLFRGHPAEKSDVSSDDMPVND